MATLEKGCIFADTCKNAGVEGVCNYTCYPHAFMYGVEGGRGGLLGTTGVPNKYKNSTMHNLPIETENPKAYEFIKKYCANSLKMILEKHIGIFLFSIPNPENPFGTGTGKTTSAVTVLNTFLTDRSKAYLRGELELKDNPVFFVKCTELQNTFNAQFRGTPEMQEKAAVKYYSLKKRIKETELVVLDDIATRGSKVSEAYSDELYEILDYRATNEKGATIFTANVNMQELTKSLGERIASRISGMTVALGLQGNDNRVDDLFK
ncbi:P-loop NTPase family protein [Rummeliibacillus stabekisii]|uniref:DNA replication protein n=1 Tax=Rummeliibacillus stabekisii TaxID=241244 RepID=UPI00371D4E89